jgi:hypothetical protein
MWRVVALWVAAKDNLGMLHQQRYEMIFDVVV